MHPYVPILNPCITLEPLRSPARLLLVLLLLLAAFLQSSHDRGVASPHCTQMLLAASLCITCVSYVALAGSRVGAVVASGLKLHACVDGPAQARVRVRLSAHSCATPYSLCAHVRVRA